MLRKLHLDKLYLQVLVAIAIGIVLGHVAPSVGADMKPLGDGFVKLIRMIIGPIIFCSVVSGIAGMKGVGQLGRVAGKAFIYFEIVSTFALLIGLAATHLLRPGAGFNIDPATLDAKAVASYVSKAHGPGATEFFLHLIPDTLASAFVQGDILQILVVAILFGVALSALGETGKRINDWIDGLSQVLFGIVKLITRLAPIGAFGAIAFTIGKYGVVSLIPMLKLIFTLYLTCFLFVVIVLGGIAKWCGFSIFRFLAYIKEELLVVLGTSSGESVLPQMMSKLEKMGCAKSVVGLVIPTGYSFNLDGTNIYMTMGVLFIAQALNIELSWSQQLSIIAIAMLMSKGASGVTGAAFITLAATLAVVPAVPVAGLVLILGVNRFLSECVALTNVTGNGVATVVVSAWEGKLDRDAMRLALGGPPQAREPGPAGTA
ncbi:dicarboxylate/amino acid:cation symporter [Janthinobacterium agaricidamnosum]|uniref:C4-dicarboxylate transport protein n=2 Tax=Janthinobacterium agaricidamnosum TaxID=55508 RepID=W0V0G7_9BURK|nr:dicarboxylate/amino acid:cation symporter [Janthinobacterium agaricidamnosum]CCJ67649.1 C4-dicarboxylate transporter DctA [Janthinobacterium agaricidamnosum]CDG80828.1 C4-dicarboxylate transport protein [Janthinobacterium agaricidamnosum NBRC 102515 = DSM 9628]